MAEDKKISAADFAADDTGGWVTRFLADEDNLDRRMMWRLGSWATAAVGAVTIAILANQSFVHVPRDLIANDIASQSRQIQRVAGEVQIESKRLTSALETLNTDHDRLYSRITKVEEGLDSITGSIARQAANTAGATPTPSVPKEKSSQHHAMESRAATATPADTEPIPSKDQVAAASKPEPAKSEKIAAPVPAPAPSTVVAEPPKPEPAPAVTAVPAPTIEAPPASGAPDKSASKSSATNLATQSQPTTDVKPDTRQALAAVDNSAVPEVPVRRTEFGVDLGNANSIEGLRALWQRIGSTHKELNGLSPVIAVQERHDGGRLHLRLVAGPLDDAATAAKICATLATRRQACETSVFDGQRLALNAEPSAAPAPRAPRRRSASHTVKREPLKPVQPAPAPATPPAPAR